jgi:hypothetical protein
MKLKFNFLLKKKEGLSYEKIVHFITTLIKFYNLKLFPVKYEEKSFQCVYTSSTRDLYLL